jgi:cytochrome c-type biogenesis protein CcmF
MIVELGHFALIIAFCLALPQAFFGLVGAQLKRERWMAAVRPAVAGQFVFTAASFGCLAYAFLQNDFTVLYVASNSNSMLPMVYRFAAVWGAHEGSLLLWMLVLATWSIAVAAFSRQLPDTMASRVMGTLGIVSAGFSLFILATSNPFERLWPPAIDGRDLNPLLQDPALAIHPPMLYMGYVGMAVPFAFAIAAMLEGRLEQAWARWVRPWTLAAWMFLTVGIALGSWWAYYELGWGGYWFWDPVENASFMPWLAGTALIHSLAVTETRGLFKSWTLLLAIFAFSLSLLGTFLVRSGVLISVHAFASDPKRGIFILAFLVVCIGGALSLYAWRAAKFKSNVGFEIVSRESFLLLNNVLLVAAAGLILLGTLYPLFLDALNLGKISVGPPYFATVFLVPMLPLLFLVAIGMHASWKKARLQTMKTNLLIALVAAAIISLLIVFAIFGQGSVLTIVGLTAGFWIGISACLEPIARLRKGHTLSRSMLGMSVAHLGLAVFAVGMTTVESYKVEGDIGMRPGESRSLAGFDFAFRGTHPVHGPNYEAVEAEVSISRNGKPIATLAPQKRVYKVQRNPMTEAGIHAGWNRDLFVALGEALGGGGNAWSMRLQYKPLVRFIWLGAVIMALGGLLTATDRRYRVPVAEREGRSVATPHPAAH